MENSSHPADESLNTQLGKHKSSPEKGLLSICRGTVGFLILWSLLFQLDPMQIEIPIVLTILILIIQELDHQVLLTFLQLG